MKCQDKYMEPETMEFENAVVTVHRPILTSEERERRMKLITAAALEVCLQVEKAENKKLGIDRCGDYKGSKTLRLHT